MNELAHKYIVQIAVDRLPDSYREKISPFISLFEVTANYPDIFENPDLPVAEKDKIDPDWRKYIIIDGNLSIHKCQPTAPETYSRLIEFHTHNSIVNIRNKNFEQAIKYLGCLSHIVGDIGQPVHQIDESTIAKLFPPPANFEQIDFHKKIESYAAKPDIGNYQPKLLGTTENQIKLGLLNELNELAKKSAPYVGKILQAIYEGVEDDKINAIASEPIRFCAEIFSDYLYSVFTLSCNKPRT